MTSGTLLKVPFNHKYSHSLWGSPTLVCVKQDAILARSYCELNSIRKSSVLYHFLWSRCLKSQYVPILQASVYMSILFVHFIVLQHKYHYWGSRTVSPTPMVGRAVRGGVPSPPNYTPTRSLEEIVKFKAWLFVMFWIYIRGVPAPPNYTPTRSFEEIVKIWICLYCLGFTKTQTLL